ILWWLLVSFGSYSLWKLGWGVYTSRDCPEAYHELLQEINEAKNDLCSRTGDGNLIFQLGLIWTGSASLSSSMLLFPSFRATAFSVISARWRSGRLLHRGVLA
ncbi:DPM3-domain-containing protein, partial [Suillus weaverae]